MALATLVYHFLASPAALAKLKKELEVAIPDAETLALSSQVDNLPYLVRTSVRLGSLTFTDMGARMPPSKRSSASTLQL